MRTSGHRAGSRLPVDREEALERAASGVLDVLVVGAGITGAGVALDAALRGYRVALVDRDDVAAGTSSRSSKLVHGGLRYLADGDVAMVVEGVRERDRTRRMAPHLVRPLAFAVPTRSLGERALLKTGLLAYDSIGAGRAVARHDRLSPAALAAVAPTLRRTGAGAYRYWDARTDDARLTLAVVQTARRHGVLVATHARVDQVLVDDAGRATGAVVTDRRSGGTATWAARWVVAAGGVWAGSLRGLAPAGAWQPTVTPARGAHLVFPLERLPVGHAVVFPGLDGHRRLFAVPWGRQVYVGTNDVPGERLEPVVTEEDADYLLGSVAASFTEPPGRGDVVGAWAGVRPLVGAGSATTDLSRRHLVEEDPAGFVHVTGGKLTTWRAMAEHVVDTVVAGDGRRAVCRTVGVALGASGDRRDGDRRARAVGRSLGVGPVAASALYHRHGDEAPAVMAACAAEPGGLEPLSPGLPYLRGEVRWAVRHELARTVDDVLSRRTRLALRERGAGLATGAVDHVVAVLGEELDHVDPRAERAAYAARVRQERGAVADATALTPAV